MAIEKIFFDSDIMLDVTLKRQPFYKSSANALENCRGTSFKAVTSSIAFINTHYFLNKFARSTKYQSLKGLRSVISIIEVDEKIIDLALNSSFSDFEDSVQFYAAKSAAAETILTRNIKDYKESSIKVLTPEQFLRTL